MVTEAFTPGKQDKFQPLRDAYGAALPGRIAEVCDAWTRVEGGGSEAVDWREFQRLIHTISGSAGTFGFDSVGAKARELEDFMSELEEYPRDERKAVIKCHLASLTLLANKS